MIYDLRFFKNNQSGQALVTLLFFSIITIIITTSSIVLILSNSLSANSVSQGDSVYTIAESGVENAILRLLRNPSYTGEIVSIGGGSATVQVSGNNPYTITSVGTVGNFQRTVVATVSYTNNIYTVTSWKESY